MPYDNPANIGTRIVDNNPVTQDKILTSPADGTVVFSKIDMTEAQSFYLRVVNNQTAAAVICPSSIVTLTWYDITGTFVVGEQTYQLNFPSFAFGPVTSFINDRCRGSLLTVTMTALLDITGTRANLVNVTQDFTLISSTRPVDAPRYYDDYGISSNSSQCGSDGIVIDFNSSLAGAATTGYAPASLSSGPLTLEISQGSGGTGLRLDLSWGNAPVAGGGQNGVFSYTVAPASINTIWVSSPPPKHPLFWKVTNLAPATAVNYNVHCWAQ